MKIVCLVKFVPDVDNFKYDFESNTVVRENVRIIINPDDACAVAFALKVKQNQPDTTVEIVTMAPRSVLPLVEDLLRIGVDKAAFISDPVFSGGDSYATSKVISRYLKTVDFDLILTGTHSIDGDTSHVPAQIGELLNLCQMSNVIHMDEGFLDKGKAVFTVDSEVCTSTYEVALPAVLSLQKESKYKLPYIKYEDLNRDVKCKIDMISNTELNLKPDKVGLKGSLTKVSRTFVKEYEKRDKVIVSNDEEGIERVYSFLKEKGFV
jgi:electron transfer flavoprotein beta subunit